MQNIIANSLVFFLFLSSIVTACYHYILGRTEAGSLTCLNTECGHEVQNREEGEYPRFCTDCGWPVIDILEKCGDIFSRHGKVLEKSQLYQSFYRLCGRTYEANKFEHVPSTCSECGHVLEVWKIKGRF